MNSDEQRVAASREHLLDELTHAQALLAAKLEHVARLERELMRLAGELGGARRAIVELDRLARAARSRSAELEARLGFVSRAA